MTGLNVKHWAALAATALALAAGGANAQTPQSAPQGAPAGQFQAPDQAPGNGPWHPGMGHGPVVSGQGGQGFEPHGRGPMSEEERAALQKLSPSQKAQLRAAHEQLKSDVEKTRADFERFQALREQFGLPKMKGPHGHFGEHGGFGGPGMQQPPRNPPFQGDRVPGAADNANGPQSGMTPPAR